MYTPDKFQETRVDVLHGCMRGNALSTLVYAGASGLIADHVPFLVDPEPAPFGTLRGHVARANPVWKECPVDREVLVVFHGLNTYITPSWYAAKREHGKVVPTWNYVVVHAYGRPRFIEDPAWLRVLVTQLTDTHEAGRAEPWKVTDAPEDYLAKQLRAIVGVEIVLTRLIGKWKANQNRSAADVRGVIAGLTAEGDAFASMMRAPGSP
jgi:transcriptional regulator